MTLPLTSSTLADRPSSASVAPATAAAAATTAASVAPVAARKTPTPAALRILGIDPGLANCGWGVIEVQGSRLRPVAYGCISTAASEQLPARLKTIADELRAVVRRYQPRELGIETVYQKGNQKSAIATAQARGAALVAAAELELEIGEFPPATIKNAVVGNGSASKEQIQYMVQMLLGLDHQPQPDHAADALAAAICRAHLRSSAQ